MKPRWRKLGKLFELPEKKLHPKLVSHASNPLALYLEQDLYRVFYSGRDAKNRSSIGAVDIDIKKGEIIYMHDSPFFIHGGMGSFFSDGISIGNCYKVDNIQYMLFMGWENPINEHWRGFIGRLIVKPDFSLVLSEDIPLLDLNEIDPISLSYPFVMENEDGTFHMWYGSTVKWDAGNGEMLHIIKWNYLQFNKHYYMSNKSIILM